MRWLKNLFKRGNNNFDQDIEGITDNSSSEMSHTTHQKKWATNAPFHWPQIAFTELSPLRALGVTEEVNADPFELVDFAVQLKDSFEATSVNCSIKEIRSEEYGQGIDFVVEDSGQLVPVVVYPRGGEEAMDAYLKLTDRLESEGFPVPVYFAPLPFDFADSLPESLSSKSETSAQAFDVRVQNLLPRVVSPDFLNRFPADAGLIVRDLENTGLKTVLVLDRDDAMAFITKELLNQLEMTSDEAFQVALENLSNKKPDDVVRGVIENNQMMNIKMLDGYDAARILTIPKQLHEDESVAAIISDRDTLVLLAVSDEKDSPEFWESLADFPRASDDSPPITNRPLKVTRHGFELR